jgi:restriction system protein
MVRAGRYGEREQDALDGDFVTIGWNELPTLSSLKSRDELKQLMEETYPNEKKMAIANYTGQVWAFYNKIKIGDLVALPLKTQSAIAIGKITGPYEYRTDLSEDIHHTRKVEWIRKDIPRTDLDQDLLYSLGAFMTVCQISRNNAEERIRNMLKITGKKDETPRTEESKEEVEEPLNIEEIAMDQIRSYIDKKFKGHNLVRLVDAIIQAKGYVTQRATLGPDGGADILAGSGPFGLSSPKLCVQVKSGSSPVDITVFRNLQGIASTFKADQGLLVSWGGFNQAVIREARTSFFTIRLWDSGELINQIQRHYDQFPDSLKAELPLQKIWSLVPEE